MPVSHPRKVRDTNLANDMLQMTGGQELLDRMTIADLVVHQRPARDNGFWEKMASCHHKNSSVNVSWFKGCGADFVAGTVREAKKRIVRTTAINFHAMTPPAVTIVVIIHGDHALAETSSALCNFMHIDGIEVTRKSFVTLPGRARRTSTDWLIARLRCIHVRDLLLGCNPCHPPVLDEARWSRYRRPSPSHSLQDRGTRSADARRRPGRRQAGSGHSVACGRAALPENGLRRGTYPDLDARVEMPNART